MPGKSVTIQKIIDPATGKSSVRSTDGSIQSAQDLVRWEEAELKMFRQRHGRLSPSLVSGMSGMNPEERRRVVVTLKPPAGIVYLDKMSHSQEELKRNSLDAASAKPPRSLDAVLASYDIQDRVDLSAFTAVVNAPKAILEKLAREPDVASVDEYVPAKTTLPILPRLAPSLFSLTGGEDYVVLARSAYSHSQALIPSNLATGTNGATFESGLTGTFLGCAVLNSVPVWDEQPNPYTPAPGLGDTTHNLETQYHSLATFLLMTLAGPGASYFHRRSVSFAGTDDQDFIVDNGLNSISMSTSGSSELAMDDFAYRSPFPTFVTGTGNAGYMYQSNWSSSYNQISVGMVDDSEFTWFKIPINGCSFGSTQTRNPDPVNGSCVDGGTWPSCAGDREMPYLVAPGWSPRGGVQIIPGGGGACDFVGTMLSNTCTNELITWGTSASAPTVNGMVLDLLGQVSWLKSWPEGTRAVILATTQNVTGGYWDSHIDGLDGNGVIHGQEAINLANRMVQVDPGNTAVTDGIWTGALYQSDFTGSPKRFNIRMPSSLPSGKHLRVVLTWDSSPDLNANVNSLSDIDLVYDGTYYSGSYNANIEVIDVPATATPAGSTHSVDVYPFFWRHTSGARIGNIYASLVWTFVADHAR